MRLVEISERLECSLEGDPNKEILGVDRIETASPQMLTFLANRKYVSKLKATRAGAIIVDNKLDGNGHNLLRHPNPYLTYARALELFYTPYRPAPSISPDARIAPTAKIGKGVFIGPFVMIDEGVEIGDDCYIFPNVTIYRGATIGRSCVLHANVAIREEVQIGNYVVIKNGAVVGTEGFGFAKREDGSHYKIIQTGKIVIEDDVEIGACTTIDRPAIGETRVRKGVKIDNLVQIGHASEIGENTVLCAQVGLAGSSVIGKNVILSGQVGVAGHLEIGNNVIATAQTGIPGTVKPNQIISGYPAIDNRAWLKASAVFPRLPELLRDLQALQTRVEELEKELAKKSSGSK